MEFPAWLFNDSPVAKDVVVNDRWGSNTRGNNAHIEMFFTKKGKDLYCIIPKYQSKVTIKNFHPAGGASFTVLGYDQRINWKQRGRDGEIDLSSLEPNAIKKPLVIKLENSL